MVKVFFRGFFLFLVGTFLFSCSVESCKESDFSSGNSISIVDWNVQTFFDGQTQGAEYSNFKNSKYWNEEKYKTRLKRLCDVITTLDADIFVFEEIENIGILYDIYNQLSGNSWDSNKMWNYGSFYKDEKTSIGLAVLSKIPLGQMKIHSMDIRVMNESQPSSRPIMELEVCTDGGEFTLFVNHWKSKVSGNLQGEVWRQWQELVLSQNLSEKEFFLATGDFNKDILEFVISNDAKICLRGSSQNVFVKSPWLNSNGNYKTKTGSYYYKENWERIDHFFSSEKLNLVNFQVCTNGEWANEDETPKSYKIFTGKGFSDHLPIMCKILLGDD